MRRNLIDLDDYPLDEVWLEIKDENPPPGTTELAKAELAIEGLGPNHRTFLRAREYLIRHRDEFPEHIGDFAMTYMKVPYPGSQIS